MVVLVELEIVSRFATCEQFWAIYSHMVKPGELASHSDFHLFKMGLFFFICFSPLSLGSLI